MRHKKHTEHSLQSACIEWFRLQYPKYALNLFAIPNGAKRTAINGKYYVKEGLTKGVADCFLAVASDELHGIFIEFKSERGTQTDAQKEFQFAVMKTDYAYWVVRDIDNFMSAINNYLR